MAKGNTYAVALAEAQRLGFAEADPTLDVNGADAADKLAVLCHLAFGTHVTRGQSITAGQVIGTVGSTGRTSGAHFHWEIAVNGDFVDAKQFLEMWKPS